MISGLRDEQSRNWGGAGEQRWMGMWGEGWIADGTPWPASHGPGKGHHPTNKLGWILESFPLRSLELGVPVVTHPDTGQMGWGWGAGG